MTEPSRLFLVVTEPSRLFAGVLQRKRGFRDKLFHEGREVQKVAVGQFLSQLLRFFLVSIIPIYHILSLIYRRRYYNLSY